MHYNKFPNLGFTALIFPILKAMVAFPKIVKNPWFVDRQIVIASTGQLYVKSSRLGTHLNVVPFQYGGIKRDFFLCPSTFQRLFVLSNKECAV